VNQKGLGGLFRIRKRSELQRADVSCVAPQGGGRWAEGRRFLVRADLFANRPSRHGARPDDCGECAAAHWRFPDGGV